MRSFAAVETLIFVVKLTFVTVASAEIIETAAVAESHTNRPNKQKLKFIHEKIS